MKNPYKLFLLGAVIVACTTMSAQAQLFYATLTSTTGEENSDPEDFDIGTSFTVGSSDIEVTALGAWGGAGNTGYLQYSTAPTLPVSTTAYLWNSSGTELGSVSLAAGTAATSASTVAGQGWAFGTLATPVVLTAGDTYYISNDTYTAASQSPGLGYTRLSSTAFTVGTGIVASSINGAYTGDGSFPSGNAGTPPPFGGNFEYTVLPEPSTWTLMIGGLGALAFLVRRRASKA